MTEKPTIAVVMSDRELTQWQSDALCEAGIDHRLLFSTAQFGEASAVPIGVTPVDHNGAAPAIAEACRLAGVKLVLCLGATADVFKTLPDDVTCLAFHHDLNGTGPAAAIGVTDLRNNTAGLKMSVLARGPKMGTVVEAGQATSKIQHHSLRKTQAKAFLTARDLLVRVLRSAATGGDGWLAEKPVFNMPVPVAAPTSATHLDLSLRLAWRKLNRVIYGAFFEKKWAVVLMDVPDLKQSDVAVSTVKGRKVETRGNYTFYADPFFSPDGTSLWVEAMDPKTGLGDVIALDRRDFTLQDLHLTGAHYSYPQAIRHDDRDWVLPETGSHQSPQLIEVGGTGRLPLKGLEGLRLLDATLFEQSGQIYLFANPVGAPSDRLDLFVAPVLTGPYRPHPANPIVADPLRARMGGNLVTQSGRLFRLGQNNAFGYGSSLTICDVTDLSPQSYAETPVGTLRFTDARGPHTLNIHGDRAVLDFYHDRFDLLAGYRRFRALLHRRKG